MPGRKPNRRGVSIQFGPDVTSAFLADNNLELLVRSHEVKPEGYEFDHNNKLITIFSAPNYCDSVGNKVWQQCCTIIYHFKGAYILFNGNDMKPVVKQFTAVPHPNLKPMAYSTMSQFE